MPEFPEVYTITSDLSKILKNAIIKSVTPIDEYKLYPSNDFAIKALEGAKILGVTQVAKNIVIQTDKGFLTIHLAMTGQILVKKSAKPMKWERVTFEIETPDKRFFLGFRDMRMFGKVKFLNKEEFDELKTKYGPNPLIDELPLEKFIQILKSKRTNIKNLLMEQGRISGLGNIYATEALFLSGIQPENPSKKISKEQAELLLESIKKVLKEGINQRGSTLDDEMFVDVFGKKGKYQDYLKIYNKKSCPNCNTKVETVKISGRNSYFCPHCQPRTPNKDK